MNKEHWYYERSGQKVGPFSLVELQRLTKTNLIHPDTVLVHENDDRLPAGDLLDFEKVETPQPVVESKAQREPDLVSREAVPLPPPPPPPALPLSAANFNSEPIPQPPKPWNPRTIGWLGLIFSPVWAGIMAAVNARRLKSGTPIWRPILIGVGSVVVDVFVEGFLFESYLFSLVLYLGALWLIWALDMEPQVSKFDAGPENVASTGSWVVPALAGSPLALLVFLTFIVFPFLPLQPREVCQAFVVADSLDEAKDHCTSNLWPALAALYEMKDGKKPFDGQFEWTVEEEAPIEFGGYLVGYRAYREEQGESHLTEGFFHLVNYDNSWKIEECYFTAYNGEQAPEPIPLSQTYREITGPSSPRQLANSSETPKQSEADRGDTFFKPWHFFMVAKQFVVAGGFKKVGVVILAACAALAGLGHWLSDNKTQ